MIGIVGVDQGTKFLAKSHLRFSRDIDFLWGTFKLTYAENKGAFLSFGASLPDALRFKIFTIAVAVFLIYVVWILAKNKVPEAQRWPYVLLLAGGIGNLIDRSLYQYVVDFLWLGYGVVRTGVFNVADMAIMLGVILLLKDSFKKPQPQ